MCVVWINGARGRITKGKGDICGSRVEKEGAPQRNHPLKLEGGNPGGTSMDIKQNSQWEQKLKKRELKNPD